jgi:deaminated glutathione amidase
VLIALIQTCTPADQASALLHITPLIKQAIDQGAELIFTPEASNLMESRPALKSAKIRPQVEDSFVSGVKRLAKTYQRPIIIGSAIVEDAPHQKPFNRCLVVSAEGQITDYYDKIHLFDADTPDGKSYRESAAISGGSRAVVTQVLGHGLGLSICYDLRFAGLYRALAHRGAQMICVGAAFTVPTGQAHWEVLLRARAIETGCYILAPAQGGLHEDGRLTYGHSLVVDPWGRLVARRDDDKPGVLMAELDFSAVDRARFALPQLLHDKEFTV